MRTLLLTLALLVAPGNAMLAQEPVVVAGSVRSNSGVPILGANVFLLETLDGALVDTVGRFTFRTAARGPVTLVILATGYLEKRTSIQLPLETVLDVTLDQAPIALERLRVEAGRFIAGDAPDVALTSLQVVTTPGAESGAHERSGGLGLRAMRQQLTTRYDGSATMAVETRPGGGFRVAVSIPAGGVRVRS